MCFSRSSLEGPDQLLKPPRVGDQEMLHLTRTWECGLPNGAQIIFQIIGHFKVAFPQLNLAYEKKDEENGKFILPSKLEGCSSLQEGMLSQQIIWG